jgi:peptidoglycan/LPS O-acetylase OafA/YrhL
VEEQFYLLSPWLFLLWLAYRSRRRMARLLVALGMLGTLTVASFITAAKFSLIVLTTVC